MKPSRALTLAAYLLAAMLVLIPFMDLLVAILPFRPASVTWRYASAGSFSRALLTPLLGLLLATVAGTFLEHRRALRTTAAVAAALTLLVLIVAARFLLDASTMSAGAPAEASGPLALGTASVLVKMISAAVLGGLTAVAAFRQSDLALRAPHAAGKRSDKASEGHQRAVV